MSLLSEKLGRDHSAEAVANINYLINPYVITYLDFGTRFLKLMICVFLQTKITRYKAEFIG